MLQLILSASPTRLRLTRIHYFGPSVLTATWLTTRQLAPSLTSWWKDLLISTLGSTLSIMHLKSKRPVVKHLPGSAHLKVMRLLENTKRHCNSLQHKRTRKPKSQFQWVTTRLAQKIGCKVEVSCMCDICTTQVFERYSTKLSSICAVSAASPSILNSARVARSCFKTVSNQAYLL